MTDYQLIVIGGGPGGYDAALRAAEYGIKTALIEKKDLGGTCVNRGCIPTKTILHSSEIYHAVETAAAFGVIASAPKVDFNQLFAKKNKVSEELRSGVKGLLESKGITLIQGKGMLLGQGKVKVVAEGNESILTADDVILAAGMKPFCPPIPGIELKGVETSDTLLAGENPKFDSLVIIGGGVIGLEMATFYLNIGVKVTVIEGMSRLLPNMDRELGRSLETILKKEGMEIYTKSMVSKIEQVDDGYKVSFKNGEKEQSVVGDRVLCALGRCPDVDGLLGPGVELTLDRKLIKVDDKFATSINHVYAIGDLSSKMQLAHVASVQGKTCVDLIAGKKPIFDTKLVPVCVYTIPEIAAVGLDEETAKESGLSVVTGKSVLNANGRNIIIEAQRSFVKIVADKNSHKILGAQVMCERAADFITEFTEAILFGHTVEDMLRIMRPHPSFEEGITGALENLYGKLEN